jgi:GT2 family glycosyltransferase
MNITDISFVITTFKSEGTIYDCLNSLPREVKKLVIENSNNAELKIDLEKKYENIECYLMKENLGYGKANNFGILKSTTDYVFILNPDAKLFENTLENLCEILRQEDFTIAAPLDTKEQNKFIFGEKKIKDVELVKGFAMILNKKKFHMDFFDEQIFLYLEEIDLCKRAKKNNGRIILVNTPIQHLGGLSHGNRDNFEMEKSRNWHWMWSKFYYNKKHNGYFFALLKTLPNFLSAFFKMCFYFLIKREIKKEIYMMRFKGLLNSYLMKKSFYRPYKE